MTQERHLVSIVIPILNERENLDELQRRVNTTLESTGYPFEVILTDNGSTDGSREKIKEIVTMENRWSVIFLSRNFGHQNSLLCGLENARGEAVITMDGDLQDPPEVIPELIAKWKQGMEVVSTVRSTRAGEPFWRLALIHCFYKIMFVLSGKILGNNSGDFRLLSRKALVHLLAMPEKNLFIRGLVPLIGFPQTFVKYKRDERQKGKSKMGFGRLLGFALDGITSTTILPLRIATLLGVASLCFSMGFTLWAVIFFFFFDNPYIPGWTTIVVLITGFSGLILMTLGIIGEYIGKIFHEVKARPRYVVEEILGRNKEN